MVARSTYFANEIRKDFIEGEKLSVEEFAKQLQCDEKTITNYRNVYRAIQTYYPDKLYDFDFNLKIKRVKEEKYEFNRDYNLEPLFYALINEFKLNYCITIDDIYPIYKSKVPYCYSKKIFGKKFNKWRLDNNICKYRHLRIRDIPKSDLEELIKWRKFASDSHRYKRALALLASYNGRTLKEISDFVDKPIDIVLDWFKEYWSGGLIKLKRKKYT